MVLLISVNQQTIQQIQKALSAFKKVIIVGSLEQALTQFDEAARPTQLSLILLDTTMFNEPLAACRALSQEPRLSNVAIVGLIDQVDQRQAILAAGVDDYLLLPLVEQELQARLFPHLHIAFQQLGNFAEIVEQLNRSATSTTLNQYLAELALIFGAESVWLTLVESYYQTVRVIATHNLPDVSDEQLEGVAASALLREADGWQPCLSYGYQFTVLLKTNQETIGLFCLLYKQQVDLPRSEYHRLLAFAQTMGNLLEVYKLQQEIQTHATQIAFVLLLSQMMSDSPDLTTILAHILQQTASLLNASSGSIWLLSDDEQWLDLAYSLSSNLVPFAPHRRAMGQGLVGWVAEHQQRLHLDVPVADSRFDPIVDHTHDEDAAIFLAIPLRHHDELLGVLALHRRYEGNFTQQDVLLMEGIANLGAAAISNARMMSSLWQDAQQRQVLYEMSQEIAAGLELQPTVESALRWGAQLVDTEFGLLWLNQEQHLADSPPQLELVACFGIDLPDTAPLPHGEGLIGHIAERQKPEMINHLTEQQEVELADILKSYPRNLIAVPMVHDEQTIGVMAQFNKQSGVFTATDLTQLLTAIEIVVIAISNAKLHQRTVQLIRQQETLYQQAIGAERLATIGRLASSLSHEINNPMQAIRGALVLAQEEVDNPDELQTYLDLCLTESERVVNLIDRLRQIYRPSSNRAEEVALNQILQDAVFFAQKELRRQRVNLVLELAEQMPSITVISHQIQLVFTNTLLNLGTMIGQQRGGLLRVRTVVTEQQIVVEFLTDVTSIITTDLAQTKVLQRNALLQNSDIGLSLSFSHDIVAAHGGEVEVTQREALAAFLIKLPQRTTRER